MAVRKREVEEALGGTIIKREPPPPHLLHIKGPPLRNDNLIPPRAENKTISELGIEHSAVPLKRELCPSVFLFLFFSENETDSLTQSHPK